MSRARRDSGRILVEMLLVTPILIMVPLYILEMTRVLGLAQATSALSREISQQTFRRCSDFRERGPVTATETRTTDCMAGILTLQTAADAMFPDLVGQVRMIVSVYRYDDTGTGTPRLWKVGTSGETGTFTTQFSISGGELIGPSGFRMDAATVQNRQRIVVGEVYGVLKPMYLPRVLSYIAIARMGQPYYEAQIL